MRNNAKAKQENEEMKREREEMLNEKETLTGLREAQTAKLVMMDRHQPGCQPQKLPPLPHFDGKEPKRYRNFERRACAMLEANKLMADDNWDVSQDVSD